MYQFKCPTCNKTKILNSLPDMPPSCHTLMKREKYDDSVKEIEGAPSIKGSSLPTKQFHKFRCNRDENPLYEQPTRNVDSEVKELVGELVSETLANGGSDEVFQ